jgi:hypothetical protein
VCSPFIHTFQWLLQRTVDTVFPANSGYSSVRSVEGAYKGTVHGGNAEVLTIFIRYLSVWFSWIASCPVYSCGICRYRLNVTFEWLRRFAFIREVQFSDLSLETIYPNSDILTGFPESLLADAEILLWNSPRLIPFTSSPLDHLQSSYHLTLYNIRRWKKCQCTEYALSR